MARENTKRVVRRTLAQRGPMVIHGEKDENFEYRYINDTGSRIQLMREAGYELVENTELKLGDSRVSDPTNLGNALSVTSNDGTKSYLMRIKKEWYLEDQQAKEQSNAELEKALKQDATQMDYGKVEIK